ncbi:hypothetical protein Ahy_A03g011733 [Arachis hypogaea]|uniref:Aminotransferase-like plant mobile domain-containing protein n=1 Tax=Arachis hypogaea TaxID=3818 RepID=A0A445DRR1_ARAHY|nr:hypothetical protein Ahy_A03g011733 [Arachis hypogaea]
MRGHSALLNTLVERWRLETHTFHLPVGKVTVTLEDASYILGLPINGEAVTVRSNSCHQFLVENCIACFGRESGPDDHVFEKVNIVWIWQCRDTDPCDTQESLERYVRAHIFCVLGIIVFPEKSTVLLNSKFLPLLRDFHRISRYSWGTASLAHLYRSLCCASRYNCKKMDGPLILFFVWYFTSATVLAFIVIIIIIIVVVVVVVVVVVIILFSLGGVIGADIRDIYDGLLRILGEDSTTWELTIRIVFLIGLLVDIVQFIWRPYMGVGIPDVLAPHMAMCSTQSPLVSFECIE